MALVPESGASGFLLERKRAIESAGQWPVAEMRTEQYLNSGILPKGSKAWLVKRLAAASV